MSNFGGIESGGIGVGGVGVGIGGVGVGGIGRRRRRRVGDPSVIPPPPDPRLLARIAAANLAAKPKEPQGPLGALIPDVIEKPVGKVFGVADLAARQVADALVHTPMGQIELIKALGKDWYDFLYHTDLTPERLAGLGKSTVEQTYQDFRHPLRNPGYLALDIAGILSLKGPARLIAGKGKYGRMRRGEPDPQPSGPLPSSKKPLEDLVAASQGEAEVGVEAEMPVVPEKPAEGMKDPIAPDEPDDHVLDKQVEEELDKQHPDLIEEPEQVPGGPEATPVLTSKQRLAALQGHLTDKTFTEEGSHPEATLPARGPGSLPEMQPALGPKAGLTPRALRGGVPDIPHHPAHRIASLSVPVREGAQWGVQYDRRTGLWNIFSHYPPGHPEAGKHYYRGHNALRSPTDPQYNRPLNVKSFDEAHDIAQAEAKAHDYGAELPLRDMPEGVDAYTEAMTPENEAYRSSLEMVQAPGVNRYELPAPFYQGLGSKAPGELVDRNKRGTKVTVELDEDGFAQLATIASRNSETDKYARAAYKALEKQAAEHAGAADVGKADIATVVRRAKKKAEAARIEALQSSQPVPDAKLIIQEEIAKAFPDRVDITPGEVDALIEQIPEAPAAATVAPPIKSVAEAKGAIKAPWLTKKRPPKVEANIFGRLLSHSKAERRGKPGITTTASYDPETGKVIKGSKLIIHRNAKGNPDGILRLHPDGTLDDISVLQGIRGRPLIVERLAEASRGLIKGVPERKAKAPKPEAAVAPEAEAVRTLRADERAVLPEDVPEKPLTAAEAQVPREPIPGDPFISRAREMIDELDKAKAPDEAYTNVVSSLARSIKWEKFPTRREAILAKLDEIQAKQEARYAREAEAAPVVEERAYQDIPKEEEAAPVAEAAPKPVEAKGGIKDEDIPEGAFEEEFRTEREIAEERVADADARLQDLRETGGSEAAVKKASSELDKAIADLESAEAREASALKPEEPTPEPAPEPVAEAPKKAAEEVPPFDPSTPTRVYHGSPEGVRGMVDTAYHTKPWQEGIGFYVSEAKGAAEGYAKGRTAGKERKAGAAEKGRITEAELKAGINVLDMDAPADMKLWAKLGKRSGYTSKEFKQYVVDNAGENPTNKRMRQELLDSLQDQEGTDAIYSFEDRLAAEGIQATTHVEGTKKGKPHRVYIVKDENAITLKGESMPPGRVHPATPELEPLGRGERRPGEPPFEPGPEPKTQPPGEFKPPTQEQLDELAKEETSIPEYDLETPPPSEEFDPTERYEKAQEKFQKILDRQEETGKIPDKDSPEAKEYAEALREVRAAKQEAKGTAGAKGRIGNLGVRFRELRVLGVPEGNLNEISRGIKSLKKANALDPDSSRKVFTDALGKAAGEEVHAEWLKGLAPRGGSGQPAVSRIVAARAAMREMMVTPKGGVLRMGKKTRLVHGLPWDVHADLPLSNWPLLGYGQKKLLPYQQRMERQDHVVRAKILKYTVGMGKTYAKRKNIQADRVRDILTNMAEADFRIQPSMIPHMKKAFPIIEKITKDEVTKGKKMTIDEVHAKLEEAGVEISKELVQEWHTRSLQTFQFIKEQMEERRGHTSKPAEWFDTMNELAVMGTLFLKPGYFTPNFLSQVAIHLSDLGFSPNSLRKTWSLRAAVHKERPDITAKIRSGVGEGIAASLSPHQGKIKFVSKKHRQIADFYSRGISEMGVGLDTPWRERAFYTEARRHGFDTQEKVIRLMTEDSLNGKMAEIFQRANKNIVDFGRMNKMERTVVKRIVFFYPWLKGASMFSARFLTEHPVQAGINLQAGRAASEKYKDLLGPLPSYMEGVIPAGTRNVPGLGKVPRVINPQAFTVLGTLGETMGTIRGLLGGNVREAEQVSEMLTPALNIAVGGALRVDPFTGRSYPATYKFSDIAVQELEQTLAAWKTTLNIKKGMKISSGEVSPKEILFPRSPGESLGQFLTGVQPTAFNPREARSRAFAEERTLESKKKREVANHRFYYTQYEEAARETGVIGPNETLPPEVRKSFAMRAARYANIAAAEASVPGRMSQLDRMQADLGLLIRQRKMSDADARALLTQAASSSLLDQGRLARKIREMAIGNDYISIWRKTLNAQLEAQGQPILKVP